jgi:hypothetical protein
MKIDNTTNNYHDRTILASIVATFMVVIGLIPAAIAVFVYSAFFIPFVGSSSWLPYVDEIAKNWFPELLRGIIAGFVAISATGYLFSHFNEQAVRLSAMMFWTAVIIVILVLSLAIRGITPDIVGPVALIIGLGVGLWANEVG